MLKLIKLTKMAGVMHEADHAYSIWSTWWLHRLASDLPFIAYVINLPYTFTHYLELPNFQVFLWSGLLYFRILTICLLLVYSVSAAGYHSLLRFASWHNSFTGLSLAPLYRFKQPRFILTKVFKRNMLTCHQIWNMLNHGRLHLVRFWNYIQKVFKFA